MRDTVGEPALKSQIARPVEVMIVVVGLLILLALYGNFSQNRNIQKVQQEGIQRGYINRAVSCDLAKAIGSSEPEACQDHAIDKYRDHDLVVGSTAGARASNKTQELVCFVLKQAAKEKGSTLVLPPGFCEK